MEGPSLVIACEEFQRFLKKPVSKAEGTAKLPFKDLKKTKFLEVRSWGKHFFLRFEKIQFRIHFLMFGSYRINDPRENRIPKMTLHFGKDKIYFYSCAIKVIEGKLKDLYDWSTDTMSDEWDPKKALKKLKAKPEAMVCDILMEQDIFSGVGNIIKNEVFYNLEMHPETTVGALTTAEQRALVKETRAYCLQFYRWKKANVLKRNWHVFRKRVCPECGAAVVKEPTGKGQRISYYCPERQRVKDA